MKQKSQHLILNIKFENGRTKKIECINPIYSSKTTLLPIKNELKQYPFKTYDKNNQEIYFESAKFKNGNWEYFYDNKWHKDVKKLKTKILGGTISDISIGNKKISKKKLRELYINPHQ